MSGGEKRIETRLIEIGKHKLTQAKKPDPFLKWAGGKRALLPKILPRIPDFDGRYFEPFLGAGAVFFSIDADRPKVINDFNSDLIETYRVIRDQLPALIKELSSHENSKEHFLEVRAWDRQPNFGKLSPIKKAARFIYLNKTCFNGLYRVNSDGFFNVPFGNYKRPNYLDTENLEAVSNFLKGNVEMSVGSYLDSTRNATKQDFVYFDPPYDPISSTSSFVSYQNAGFGKQDQTDLRDEVLRLTRKGVPVLLSNSSTPFIRSLYGDKGIFKIEVVSVNRAISASAEGRKPVSEVLINNFGAIGK
jgi:DNA adenine methylase